MPGLPTEQESAWKWLPPKSEEAQWRNYFVLKKQGIFAQPLTQPDGVKFMERFCPFKGSLGEMEIENSGEESIDDFAPSPTSGKDYRYVQLTKDYRKILVLNNLYGDLQCPNPVYISVEFFRAQGVSDQGGFNLFNPEPYPWSNNAQIVTDERIKGGRSKRGEKKQLWRYIPVRGEDGQAWLLPLSSAFDNKEIESADFWAPWLESAIKISSQRYSFLRSNNLPDVELWIRPGPDLAPLSPWELKHAFDHFEKSDDVKTKYIVDDDLKESERSQYVFLSSNPFGHYSTWIKEKDLRTYLHDHKDRNYPSKETADLAMTMIPDSTAAKRRSIAVEKSILNLQHWVLNPLTDIKLTSEKIEQASGKRRTVDSQGSIMGSASNIAKECLQWTRDDPKTNRLKGGLFMAEWLHLAAFSWGGLLNDEYDPDSSNYAIGQQSVTTDDIESMAEMTQIRDALDKLQKSFDTSKYVSSQVPMNLILGTSETNSVMTRYETAWQHLFKMEAKLREQLPEGVATGKVQGDLMIYQNSDDKGTLLQTYPDASEQESRLRLCRLEPFEKPMIELSKSYPWLMFALDYCLSMDKYSAVLQQWKPSSQTTFYPYTRLFFTRGESLADKALIDSMFDRALQLLGSQIKQKKTKSSPNAPEKEKETVEANLRRVSSEAKQRYQRKMVLKLSNKYDIGEPYSKEKETEIRKKQNQEDVEKKIKEIVVWRGMDGIL